MSPELSLKPLLGKIIESIEGAHAGSPSVVITLASGERYLMEHEQDCCERVEVHSTTGDVLLALGSPVTSVYEDNDGEAPTKEWIESYTWTNFRITTEKGSFIITWLGESNGYYSESVSVSRI